VSNVTKVCSSTFSNLYLIFNKRNKLQIKKICKKSGFGKIEVLSSGHASGDEIKEMIKEINPEKLVPIHTEKADLF